MDAATLQFTVLGWRKRHGRMTERAGQTVSRLLSMERRHDH
jgi:hypothetical protein